MRIIAGQYRGRTLLAAKGERTRPITSRVKTALFSILGGAVADAVVVDLFSGTGSIGLEAISRGAGRCYFAERSRLAIARLRRNIDALHVGDRCRIWRGDVLRHLAGWLEEVGGEVDLAFVDPPYRLSAQWRWQEACRRLFDPLGGKLSPAGQIVLRCQRNIELPDALGTLCVRSRRDYGKMSLVFLSLPET